MSVEDFEMEVEEIEVRILEMMEQDDVEESTRGLEDEYQILEMIMPDSDVEGMVVEVIDTDEEMETTIMVYTPLLSPETFTMHEIAIVDIVESPFSWTKN